MEILVQLDQIDECARYFWRKVEGKVFAFYGKMGSGKTTFIRALCRAKGIEEQVSSPTFSLINEYTYKEEGINRRIFHIDLYRLRDEEEAIQAGVEDCLYSGDTCFVEWPDKIPSVLPQKRIDVHILPHSNYTRLLKIDFRS
ncbi:MAG: tRNA (adenosine(37)-N6)-threonylcarbamoyltransferase complex ATPase subunit type 1 TsaE [Chitinophagaceae bacterium]|nr:tRNA (adenosine(37)-N6)-threonylcarbamoyltransferase complex ATPase subunit type 1 TsaE [Chitinophagaceae bacterium]